MSHRQIGLESIDCGKHIFFVFFFYQNKYIILIDAMYFYASIIFIIFFCTRTTQIDVNGFMVFNSGTTSRSLTMK